MRPPSDIQKAGCKLYHINKIYISLTIVEHLKKKHHVEMDKHKRSSGKVWI